MSSRWSALIELCDRNEEGSDQGREELKPWFYTLGLHPYFLEKHQSDDCKQLESLCTSLRKDNNHFVGIGEIGLDFSLEQEGHSQQISLFSDQILLAKKLNLPVIIHARKSYDEVAAIIRRFGFTQGGIIHAFSGSLQQGQALIKLGFKLGIGGAISHSRAKKLRRTIVALPLEALVLETDSPDMKPAFLQSENNSPLSILLLAQIVASLRNDSLDKIIFSSNNNLLEAFPRMKSRLLP